jgi:YARHG domain
MSIRARIAIAFAVVSALAPLAARAEQQAYVPPPAESVPGYFADAMPCKIDRDSGRPIVACKGNLLDGKSLRELSILRNTIYARYGWDGYRKPWLRDHFHAQPWFKPNAKFTYKVLSDADRKNAHLIATREQGFTEIELRRMREDVYARYGKVWHDKPDGKCAAGDEDGSNDCYYRKQKWYRADAKFDEAKLSADDKVELGLLSRAMGSFALDDDTREKKEGGLGEALEVKALRQLSLRDLRLLRNTIYARHGRPFKSQILRDHFEGMTWYKVDAAYSDKKLSAVDTRNIALIKSVENEFGGPLSDEDYLAEPAVDGA